MQFTADHIDAFRRLSWDENPLHVDADYARRTPFGKPVVYGVCAILYGLGAWADGRRFRLLSVRAAFRKPLFVGEAYELDIQEAEDDVRIHFKRGPVDHCSISLQTAPILDDVKTSSNSADFQPRRQARDGLELEAWQGNYVPNWEQESLLESAFGIRNGQFLRQQIAALLWSSYHVGMELPGRQALFADLSIEFEADGPDADLLALQTDIPPFDARFNRITLHGKGTGMRSFQIAAFARPVPVDFPLAELRKIAGNQLLLQGKTVFISGASRGFGASLARICGACGAKLLLNYRSDSVAADQLIVELREDSIDATALLADMADADQVAALAKSLGPLDFIFNNAAPPIRDAQFLEQTNSDFLSFLNRNMCIALETTRHLLPLLKEGGTFVQISTKYVPEPAKGFSHYVAAKSAQEGFVRALSLEFHKHNFSLARLPRILTDQTNLPFDFDPPSHPGEVANELIVQILEGESRSLTEGNLRVLDLY